MPQLLPAELLPEEPLDDLGIPGIEVVVGGQLRIDLPRVVGVAGVGALLCLDDLLEGRLRPHLARCRRRGARRLRAFSHPHAAHAVGEGVALRGRGPASNHGGSRPAAECSDSRAGSRRRTCHTGAGITSVGAALDPTAPRHRRCQARAPRREVVVHLDLDGIVPTSADRHRLGAPVTIGGDPAAQERAAGIVRGHDPGREGPEQRTGPEDRHEQGEDARADPLVPLLPLAAPVEALQGERAEARRAASRARRVNGR